MLIGTYKGEVVFRVPINLFHEVWVWAYKNIFFSMYEIFCDICMIFLENFSNNSNLKLYQGYSFFAAFYQEVFSCYYNIGNGSCWKFPPFWTKQDDTFGKAFGVFVQTLALSQSAITNITAHSHTHTQYRRRMLQHKKLIFLKL